MSRPLENKRIIVTGGGSGIGRAAALLAAEQGASVVVADVNVDGGEQTITMLREHHGANGFFVRSFGMRRISHFALLVYTTLAGIWLVISLFGPMPFWLFFVLLTTVMFMFGWAGSNMNSLSMEPLGAVAGTASSVFGFLQTVGGAAIGSFVGQQFNGTVTPVATGYFTMGALALVCVLIAERGKLFGVGAEYSHTDFSHHEAH